ncbi:MAG: VPLPA-CTERM sorting domain-containing protein [Gammaproteobacteria bacterium]|nr:VPLPA-CTERM sorting domain-containing protein [Gammaproteobacteria bacterium]
MNACRSCAAAGAIAVVSLFGGVAQAAPATFFFNNTPYLSAGDIPAGFYAGGAPAVLSDLENDLLDPTLSASAGSIIGPGQFDGLRDSVDVDDGALDGSGAAGHSWFSGDGATGVTFTFVGAVLPTAFGIVWTDGGGAVTFSATDGNGNSLGSITPAAFADGSSSGTTAEDRFFGVTFDGGIKSVFIRNSSGGIELDHIQYGAMAAPVPVPAAGWLMLTGLVGLAARRRRIG